MQLRRAEFQNADLWIGGPELIVKFSDSFDSSISYFHGNTTAPGFADITHGIDRLDWLTSDRIGFEADSFALRATCTLNPFVTLVVVTKGPIPLGFSST